LWILGGSFIIKIVALEKERYFTRENINEKGLELGAIFAQQRQRGDLAFKPERSALLVLDMQDYFLESDSHAYVPSAEAIIPGLKKLVNAYTDAELPVFFTRHTNTPADAGMMAEWWRDLIQPGDPLSQITSELDTSLGSVIQKNQYDAFYQTSLYEQLIQQGISQVVIGGVMTHLCCETTARAAFTRGLQVFFLLDGTAAYNEAFHRAALMNLAHGIAILMRVADVLESLKGTGYD
jgi:bifunctional isochorismate lyase/aryl carrier protein